MSLWEMQRSNLFSRLWKEDVLLWLLLRLLPVFSPYYNCGVRTEGVVYCMNKHDPWSRNTNSDCEYF